MNDAITPAELERLLEQGAGIQILDVRKRADLVEVEYPVPTAHWRDPEQVQTWCKELDDDREAIVFCVHGHQVSRSVQAGLTGYGLRSRFVEGGVEAWVRHKKAAGDKIAPS